MVLLFKNFAVYFYVSLHDYHHVTFFGGAGQHNLTQRSLQFLGIGQMMASRCFTPNGR